ncbi:MAG: thymidylate kinase, partial [Micromonosporaceae bacterium]|nr:thymidylate kinase [Micromonosporaceae bacterium]
ARGDDDEDLDHLIAVDAAYRALPEARIFVMVDASGRIEDVQARIRSVVVAGLRTRISLPAALTSN